MTVKTFGDANGKLEVLEVLEKFEFCVKNPYMIHEYMKGYDVPVICSQLANQRVDVAEKLLPILKDLDLSDGKRDTCEIDLLIGADYYWTIIEGEIRRCNDDGLTTINSKLGWLLSGLFNEDEKNIAVELDKSNMMKVKCSLIQTIIN